MKEFLIDLYLYVVGPLGSAVIAAGLAANAFPKGSAAGEWLAWFGGMPIRHLPRLMKKEKTK